MAADARGAAARRRATSIGVIAVVLWGALPLMTSHATRIPPFQLAALTFAVAAAATWLKWLLRGENPLGYLGQRPEAWLFGVGGLFGYHAFYFAAMRNAPVIDVSLIAYLWPLMVVALSALLPGERVGWHHLAGVACGFAGTAILVTDGGSVALRAEYAGGYALAFACPVIWSSYSLLSRRLGQVPTDAVGGFCAATAALSLACHTVFERTVAPDAAEWSMIVALGLGPVGAAFFAWDYGVKHGDIRLLGVLSYGAPLLSTALLILFARAPASASVLLACALIVGGAAIASFDELRRRAPLRTPP